MSHETPAAGSEFRIVNGESDMARRIRSFDWTATPLGPVDAWPISLRTTLDLMLDTSHGMCLVWGPELTFFYNDAYAPFLVDRHPWALGRTLAEVWADVWSDIAPLVDKAMRGERVHFEDMHLTMIREGEPQDTWWTFSYSPARDDAGQVAGMLNVTTDTTRKVRALGSAQVERERLQQAMQQMPGFVALLSGPEHRFTYANDAYMEIAGHRDVLGRTVREVFPELSGQGFYDLLDRVYATGERYEARALPIRLSQDSGASRYIDLLYEAVRDDAGAVSGIFVGGYDTTDRVRADGRLLALADLSERMRTATAAKDLSHAAATVLAESLGVSRVGYAAVDGSAEGLTIAGEWSAPGMSVGADEVALQTSGDVADALSRHEMVVVTDSTLDSRTARATDALARDHARAFVNVPIVEDGRLAAVLYLANDTPRDWRDDELSLARDVAERTRSALERQTAQDGRRESEARYRALFEAVDVGFCVVEMKFDADDRAIDYRLVEINPAFERQTGLYGAQGKWVSEAAPGLERHWFDTYGAVALTGEAVRFENEAAPFERWYDVHAFRTGEPDERRVAILFNDITERRLAEQRLKALNDTLEQQVETRTAALMAAEEALRQSQKMEAVGQLTGGIAHDFNNLLAGITGSLDLIGKRIAEGRFSDVERFSSAAQQAAKRAAALTHRLLAFSRRQTLDPKPTDANRLVRDMEDLVRRTVGPAIEVEVVAAAGLWTTLVDPNQLENALLNLCINGRDAMPDGGRLTIETGNRWIDDSAARALDLTPGPYVSLSVSDTGQGMSSDVIQRAFEPFFTTKPLGEGTGLGLSMIYGFVRQSGGQVRIYSEPGEGALICLYLPRHSGKVEDADAPAATPAPPRANPDETVLVVDDEPTVRMLVSEILHDLGYHSIEAGDGLSGLSILQSNTRVDLLVTDVGLPGGMNGRQLADAARTSRPNLKVLFITGYAENAVVGNGQLESGMHVMTKPFEMAALSRRIADLIAG